MMERGMRTDDGGEPVIVPVNAAAALEQRVRHLEETVAGLQNPPLVEERIVERVAERLGPPPGPAPRDQTGLLLDAGRRLLPAAVGLLSPPPPEPEPPSPPRPS